MKSNIEKYRNNYQQLQQLSEMKKLWHHGYWDGPINGVCEVDGIKCWFETIEYWTDNNSYPKDHDAFEPPYSRRYLIYKLTDAQFKEIESRHNKFRRMVGSHSEYDDDGRRSNFHLTDLITSETVSQFYQEQKNEVELDVSPVSDDMIIGWYEW